MIRNVILITVLLGSIFPGATPLRAQTIGLYLKKATAAIVPKKDTVLYQVVRGQIIDLESKSPLPGATIWLQQDTLVVIGTSSNALGNFTFEKVRVGRFSLRVSFVGYKQVENSIFVNSSKEMVLTIPLEELSSHLDPIEIRKTALQENELGGRVLIIDNEIKLAGTRIEPVRIVSAGDPGVQSADDSRNDVVVRGNSPGSVLWRLEGVNIPNPNHFNIPGTSGGPVTLINEKMLANSAFYSGAFPSEFGNTTSGLFDLNYRTGDSLKHSSVFQFGVLGTEISSEGPLSSKHKSSYLFTARTASFKMFFNMGLDIGTDAIPYYKDASFNLNFPGKKGSSFSVFGLGGMSNIDILVSEGHRNFYGEKDRDQYFDTGTGILGVKYQRSVNNTTYYTSTLAFSAEQVKAHHDFVFPADLRNDILNYDNQTGADTLPPILDYNFREKRILSSFQLTKKLKRPGDHFKIGLNADLYLFNYFDSARNINQSDEFGTWRTRWDSKDNSVLLQPYVQWKYAAEKFDLMIGLHGQYFSVSKSYSIAESRIFFKYYLTPHQSFNVGFGLHSQIQAPYLYYYGAYNDINGKPVLLNKNMDFTRSRHSVVGYEHLFGEEPSQVRVKAEVYHQYLYNVPVDLDPTSFSLLNTGASFVRVYPDSILVNKGKGENYGLEITIDKAFANGYLFLVTGSLFQSKYKGSDGVWRNTDFNGHYMVNFNFTREWTLKKQNVISLGCRVSSVGGRWYGPVDEVESEFQKKVVYADETRNTVQFDPYFRADIRLSYKVSLKNVNHEFALDLINIFNTKNVLQLTYIPDEYVSGNSTIGKEYQLNTLPFFYYRFDF